MSYLVRTIKEIQEHYDSTVDLKMFISELERTIAYEKSNFINEIVDEYENGDFILFRIKLINDRARLVKTMSILKEIEKVAKSFNLIVVDLYLKSYEETFLFLTKKYHYYFILFSKDYDFTEQDFRFQMNLIVIRKNRKEIEKAIKNEIEQEEKFRKEIIREEVNKRYYLFKFFPN